MSRRHGNTTKKHIDKNTQSGNIVLKIVIIVIIISVIFGILIYSKNNKKSNKTETQIAKTVNNAFTELKNLDKEKVEEYINYYTLVSSLDEMIIQGDEETELEKDLFKEISWNIEDVNIEENTAVATIEMSNKNFKNIFSEWMKSIINERSNGTEISEELALEILKDTIKKETEMKTVTKEITLSKEENNWTIFVDDNLRDAIFPGIDIVDTALTSSN